MAGRGRRGGEAAPHWRRVKQQVAPSKGGSAAAGSWREAGGWREAGAGHAGGGGGGARGTAASSASAAGVLPPWRRPAVHASGGGAAAAPAPTPTPGGSPSSSGRAPLRGRLVSDPRASWADLADAETSIGSDTEDSNDVEALSRSHSCAAGVDSSSETLSTASPDAGQHGAGSVNVLVNVNEILSGSRSSEGARAEEPSALPSVPVRPRCAEAGELPAAQTFHVHGAGFTLGAAAHLGACGFWPGAEPFLEAEGAADFALLAPRATEGDGADETGGEGAGAGEQFVFAGLVPVLCPAEGQVWWLPAADADEAAGAAVCAAGGAEAAGPAGAVEPARGEAVEDRAADEAAGVSSSRPHLSRPDGTTSFKQLREDAEEFQPTPLHQAVLRACAAAEEHQLAVNHEKSLGTWCPFWWCSGLGPLPPVLEDSSQQLEIESQLLACLQGGKLSPLAEGEDSGEDAQGAPEAPCDEAAPGAAGA